MDSISTVHELSISGKKSRQKSRARIRTPGRWVRKANATSVLCSTPVLSLLSEVFCLCLLNVALQTSLMGYLVNFSE